jgi:hypothetical protein
MNPEDVFDDEKFRIIHEMMKNYMPSSYSSVNGGWGNFEDVGIFQFNKDEQKARIVFKKNENSIIADIDLLDPTSTGLSVISAFTKMVLND